jgi:ubiquinone/menaquinone biosynthesis C-methylase UbiE
VAVLIAWQGKERFVARGARSRLTLVAQVDRQQLGAYYDARYAGDYMTEHGGSEEQRVQEVLAEVPRGVTQVLDYGCGQGAWLEMLSRQFPDAEISGIDISEHAIGKARTRCPKARLLTFDGGHAPFESEGFDLVFSYHVLEHVWDLEVTVADMARLVKEGGYICAIFPCGNPGSFEERVVRLVQGGVERSPTGECRFYCEDPGHVRRMTTDEIVARFAAHGVTPVRQLFGNQCWGQVDWIARTGRAMVRQVFDPARAASTTARVKLRALRLAFLVLSPAVRLGAANDLASRIRSSPRVGRRLLLGIALAAKPLTAAVSRLLERAAQDEWRERRLEPGASAHYLLFRRVPI